MLWKELVPVLSPYSLLPSWNFFQNALVRGFPMATSQVCVFSLFDTINILWLKLLPWNIGLLLFSCPFWFLSDFLSPFLFLGCKHGTDHCQLLISGPVLHVTHRPHLGLPVHLELDTRQSTPSIFLPRHLSCTMTFMLYLSQWHNSSPQLPAHAGGESCNSVSQPWFHVSIFIWHFP